jgi:perosamine synthetase
VQAAIGIAQMNKLSRIVNKKQEIFDLYHKELSGISEIFRPVYIDERTDPVFWFTSFLTDRKRELQEFLKEKSIQTRGFFYPLNLQPCYSELATEKNFEISEKIYSQGISLPSSYILTTQEQYRVIDLIKEFYS